MGEVSGNSYNEWDEFFWNLFNSLNCGSLEAEKQERENELALNQVKEGVQNPRAKMENYRKDVLREEDDYSYELHRQISHMKERLRNERAKMRNNRIEGLQEIIISLMCETETCKKDVQYEKNNSVNHNISVQEMKISLVCEKQDREDELTLKQRLENQRVEMENSCKIPTSEGYSLTSDCHPESLSFVSSINLQMIMLHILGFKSFGYEPPDNKSSYIQIKLEFWICLLCMILILSGFFAVVLPFLPYETKDGVRYLTSSFFETSQSMVHALVISDMFAFCGSLVGVNLMSKKPKLAIFSGYVAAVSMFFTLAILAVFTVIWALKQI